MKKIILLFLSCILIFTVSCTNNSQKTVNSDADVNSETEKYNIYMSGVLSANSGFDDFVSDIKSNRDDVTVLNGSSFSPLNLTLSNSFTRTTTEEELPDISLLVQNTPIDFKYEATFIHNQISAPAMKYYGNYHSYTATDGSTLQTSAEDGTVIEYRSGSAVANTPGTVSVEQAQVIATNTLKNIYGDDILEQYSEVKVQESATSGYYAFIYFKEMFGYRTLERLSAMVNQNGEVFFIGTSYYNMYESIKDIYSEASINESNGKLLSLLSDSDNITDKSLIFDDECNLFIKLTFDSQDKNCSGEIIINVK